MLIKTLNNILLDADLTPDEMDFTKECINGHGLDFLGSTSYEKLFEYFTFGTAEMPYEIAKARMGDPDVWILDRLYELEENSVEAR